MRAVQVEKPGSPLKLVERPVPEPGPGKVRIKVEACGICHSDSFVVEGTYPGIVYPRVPGHEIGGPWRHRLARWPARWRRLAWRPLRRVRQLPAWGLCAVRPRPSAGHGL